MKLTTLMVVPSMIQDMFMIYFFQRKAKGELIGDIYCHNLRQNCAACFNRLTEAIRGCNMKCLNVSALVGRSSLMTSLTIFGLI